MNLINLNVILVTFVIILCSINNAVTKNPNETTSEMVNSDSRNNEVDYHYNTIKLENISKSERKNLDELRQRVKNLVRPSEEFLLSDRILIKWLQARDMNLDRAEEMLKNSLEWRKTNKMDKILDEDFSRWEKSYPFIIDGVDKVGHPIFLIPGGKYDVRKVMISGEADKLQRYLEQQLEYGTHYGYNLTFKTKQNQDGKGVLIVDLNGFNIRQHACLQCASFYIRCILMYEANFPRIIHKFYVINAPAGVQEVFDVVKVAMTEDSRNLIHIYGFDKTQWMPELLKQIPMDQLPVRYGGTKIITSQPTMHM